MAISFLAQEVQASKTTINNNAVFRIQDPPTSSLKRLMDSARRRPHVKIHN
jgi:hypothetical protein